MSWFIEAIKKYAVFRGRSRRKEYWYFVLFVVIISVVLSLIDVAIGTSTAGGGGLLSTLFSLAILIPSIAALVRRLHDTDRSGWWFFLSFVPIIGAIVLIVFAAQDSSAGTNRFGANPKGSVVA